MNFIESHHYLLETLDKAYNPYLVALSLLIAILSSLTAFATSERILASASTNQRILWTGFSGCLLALGIAAAHLIGSFALIPAITISFQALPFMLSVLPLILLCAVVIRFITQPVFDIKKQLFCGILLSAGISFMHFWCLSNLQFNGKILHIKSLFYLSLVISVIFSTLAGKVLHNTIPQLKTHFFSRKQIEAALLMGLAITGMHYCALQAIVFVPNAQQDNIVMAINSTNSAIIFSLIITLFFIIALIVPHLLRFKQMADTLTENEKDLKIAATAFQTQEAIMVTNANAEIVRVNDAFTLMTGYPEQEILGKNPSFLDSKKQDSRFYKEFWSTLVREGKWAGEFWGKRKNDEVFPIWQTVSAVSDEDNKATHYVAFLSDITEYKLAKQEIEKLAFYDALTELPNRRLLYERLDHELNIARRYRRAGILFFLDLDRFKHINDTLGHAIGDQLLIEIAHRLQTLLRDSDTAVRLGGDEFVILISAQEGIDTDLLEQSTIIAEKIINAINAPYIIDKHKLFISTSIGITLFTGIDENVEMLIKRADTAMYQAKKSGRNTFQFFQQSIQETVDSKLQIEKNLYIAIVEDEFFLEFQPQLNADNQVIGAEALLRWQSSDLGTVMPNEFISVAEESGLIIQIGQWVFETVCETIKEWGQQNISISHVAVNISAKQFHQSDFVPMLVHTALEYQVDPSKIMLEITEGVFLNNIEEAIDKMYALKKNGFSFSIDDFGTGYSSLTYLKRLPFDQLKIDQSFVKDVINDPSDVAIVKAIILIAKSMDLTLIAEGVETDLHLAYLSGLGCNIYQGYYFSKPLPKDRLLEYIEQRQSKK